MPIAWRRDGTDGHRAMAHDRRARSERKRFVDATCGHRYHRFMAMQEAGEVAELDELMSRSAAACLFHALSDGTRLQVVQHLLTGPHRVVDLKEHLGLAQSTVSAHVACLKDCGLVDATPIGRSTMYALSHPEATADFLRAAEELLLVTGSAVVLCPRHGVSDHDQ